MRILACSALAPVFVLALGAACPAQEAAQPAPPTAKVVSQVRIVRLSQTEGVVQLDRGTDQKYEPAFLNLPIVAGERLRTMDGLAEVEFEDNSSLRLAPNTEVEFPVLGREASGATATGVTLLRGSLYLSLVNAKGADNFTLSVGNRTITLAPSTHLRIDVAPPTAKLDVWNGSATVTDASGTMVVAKKKAVSFDLASSTPPVLAKSEAAQFDKWDKQEVEYHKARATAAAFASSPYQYGLTDLGYYGSFANFGGGCGSMWRPYFASASWEPYGSGVWSWYPGVGYSWVSPYPWGWTPFHSGSWQYCSGAGWGWQPGGSWNGLQNQPGLALHPGTRFHGPLAPHEPLPGQPTLVGVNVKAIPVSRVDTGSGFVFRTDSAGMGVPRGVFGNLGKVSQGVAAHGFVNKGVSDSQAQRGFLAISRPAGVTVPAAAAGHGSYSGSTSAGMSGVSHASGSLGSAGGGRAGGSSGSSGGHH